MENLGLYFLFVLELLSIGLLLWLARHMRTRLKDQDQKIADSLDDLDLAQFQEDVSGILTELGRASESLVKKTNEREKALSQAMEKAKTLERKLAGRAASLEQHLGKLEGKLDLMEARTGFQDEGSPLAGLGSALEEDSDEGEELSAGGENYGDFSRQYGAPPPAEGAPEAALGNDQAGEGRPASVRKVRELLEEGLNAEQISQSLGMLKGEVELIMRLAPRKH